MKYFTLLFFVVALSSCKHVTKNNSNSNNMEKNISYFLNYDLYLPYEIYINDVKIGNRNKALGGDHGVEYLNDYILNSGTNTLKLKVFSPSEDSLIPKDNLNTIVLEIYTDVNKNEEYEKIKTFKFPKVEQDLAYYEYQWTFESDVPYKILGWEESTNLSKIDKDILLDKVLKKFNDLRILLNQGKTQAFMDENKKGYEEYFVSHYYENTDEKQYLDNLFEVYADQKGYMLPIENYTLKLLGGGKLVTLESTDLRYVRECVLIAEDPEEKIIYNNYVILHLPLSSSNLEVIRIWSEYSYLEN